MPFNIQDGEHQLVAEAVIDSAVLRLSQQAGFYQFVLRVALLLEVLFQVVPFV